MSPLTNHAKDTFIAPELSGFTQADIPDMSRHSSQSSHWLGNHVLNIMLRGSWTPPLSAYVFNFLRRATYAFKEHEKARRASLASLAIRNQSAPTYAEALFHWETFLAQSWHALKLLEKAFELRLFEKGDDSAIERLNGLYNQMKHVESRIENGQMPTQGQPSLSGLPMQASEALTQPCRISRLVRSWSPSPRGPLPWKIPRLPRKK